MHIKPDRLRLLLERNGWSAAALAERVTQEKDSDGKTYRICEKTIRRAKDPENQKPIKQRAYTIAGLAKALGVETGVLTGELPMPMPEPDRRTVPDVQVGALIRSRYRLAYGLVKDRYGVSNAALIEMAPLLFTLLAERSLVCRREQVKRIAAAVAELEAQQDVAGRLAYGLASSRAEEIAAGERRSIEAHDVFGRIVPERSRDADGDLEISNPFADYLAHLAEGIDPGTVELDRDLSFADAPEGFPAYSLFEDDLAAITGGSDRARHALERGHARLTDIPNELKSEAATDARVAWLEERVPDEEWKAQVELREAVDRAAEAVLETEGATA